jgi:hypothetical protein
VPRGRVYCGQAFKDVKVGRLAFAASNNAVDVSQDQAKGTGR